jgi:hypothetical protein
MKFRKYAGEIKIHVRICIFVCAIALILSIWLMSQSGQIQDFLIIGLPIIIFAIVLSWLDVNSAVRISKGNIYDMIELDEDGVKLECKNGQNKIILWNDVMSIEKCSHFSQARSLNVTSNSGEKIWWKISNNKSEKYIFEKHPELKSVYSTSHKFAKI